VSGDFTIQLAARLPNWSAGGRLRCIVLSVCPCVVSFSKFHEHDTHDSLRASSEDVRKKSCVPILARMSRSCYEETASVEFKLDPVDFASIKTLTVDVFIWITASLRHLARLDTWLRRKLLKGYLRKTIQRKTSHLN